MSEKPKIHVLIGIWQGCLHDVRVYTDIKRARNARDAMLRDYRLSEEDKPDNKHNPECRWNDENELHLHTIKLDMQTAGCSDRRCSGLTEEPTRIPIIDKNLLESMVRHPLERRFTLEQLQTMKTISTGQADDLKYDNGKERHWLSRCTVEDGEPYNNKVTVEHLVDGKWVVTYHYQARD